MSNKFYDRISRNEKANLLKAIAVGRDRPDLFAKNFLGIQVRPYNMGYVNSLHKWLVYRAGRKIGKTTTTAMKALHYGFYASTMDERIDRKCEILIAAPRKDQADIMFGRIRDLFHWHPLLESLLVRETASDLEFNWFGIPKSKTHIMTRAAGDTGVSLRGYDPNVIILDEVAYMPRAVVTSVIPAAISQNACIWLTSTPNVTAGYFFDRCKNALGMTEDALTCCSSDPNAKWHQYAINVENVDRKFVPQEVLDEQKDTLSIDEYEQEVKGNFINAGNALIPIELILEAQTEYTMPSEVRYVMGVDVASSGTDETIYIIMAYDKNGYCYVRKTISEGTSTWRTIVDKIRDIYYQYHELMDTIYIDASGGFQGVVDMAVEAGLPARGVVFSSEEKILLFKNMTMLFEKKKIKFGNVDRKLVNQLLLLKKEITDGGRLKIVSDDKHDDYPAALALACRAVDARGSWHIPIDTSTGKMFNIDDLF